MIVANGIGEWVKFSHMSHHMEFTGAAVFVVCFPFDLSVFELSESHASKLSQNPNGKVTKGVQRRH
jgi:hypothetical protein